MNQKRLRHVDRDWRSAPHPDSHSFRKTPMYQANLDALREQIQNQKAKARKARNLKIVAGTALILLVLAALYASHQDCLNSEAQPIACTD